MKNFGVVANPDATIVNSSQKLKMGFNFTIRPKSILGKRDVRRPEETRTTEIDKYLSKIRKSTKYF